MTMTAPAVATIARRDFAADYADFSANLRIESMPPQGIEAVKADIFDTLACATAGISAEGVDGLVRLVGDWGGKPEAAVWCTGLRVPAHHAAWVNGMMSHARDFDDTHDGAVLHAGVSVVPAAIAAAELNPEATGADLLAGVAAGLELDLPARRRDRGRHHRERLHVHVALRPLRRDGGGGAGAAARRATRRSTRSASPTARRPGRIR